MFEADVTHGVPLAKFTKILRMIDADALLAGVGGLCSSGGGAGGGGRRGNSRRIMKTGKQSTNNENRGGPPQTERG